MVQLAIFPFHQWNIFWDTAITVCSPKYLFQEFCSEKNISKHTIPRYSSESCSWILIMYTCDYEDGCFRSLHNFIIVSHTQKHRGMSSIVKAVKIILDLLHISLLYYIFHAIRNIWTYLVRIVLVSSFFPIRPQYGHPRNCEENCILHLKSYIHTL